MIADTQAMEKIVVMVQELSPEYRLRIIHRITETLLPSHDVAEPKPLQFGKYRGSRMSTIEDFSIAEWWPTDGELNGA
ncbi:MAG: hypothetical protein KBG20_11465 [Caldilineaceae bacterium]|nr:hypothetical protein [Caldilineaceae bacterium]MBP8122773.1 hypothetical protein [Caldilineaceae bacterium]MBP9072915.1 hypothetical protein [Caldilineaceae bacterium]